MLVLEFIRKKINSALWPVDTIIARTLANDPTLLEVDLAIDDHFSDRERRSRTLNFRQFQALAAALNGERNRHVAVLWAAGNYV